IVSDANAFYCIRDSCCVCWYSDGIRVQITFCSTCCLVLCLTTTPPLMLIAVGPFWPEVASPPGVIEGPSTFQFRSSTRSRDLSRCHQNPLSELSLHNHLILYCIVSIHFI